MHAMSKLKLDKVERALNLCHDLMWPTLSCEECPYYRLGDSCWNKMHEDMKEIIVWSRDALDVIQNLIGKLGGNSGFAGR